MLRITTALDSTFHYMCNPGFCFYAYVNMTVCAARFDFSVFGCVHHHPKLLHEIWL